MFAYVYMNDCPVCVCSCVRVCVWCGHEKHLFHNGSIWTMIEALIDELNNRYYPRFAFSFEFISYKE